MYRTAITGRVSFPRTPCASSTRPRFPLPGTPFPAAASRCWGSGRTGVLGTPIIPPFPEGTGRAVFGMGCFWGAERMFWQANGVYTTAAGYAGGLTPNPTYKEVCSGRTGHTEVVLAVFDPAQTSYDEMLRIFWEGHDPTQGMRQGNDVGTQYRSALYFENASQHEAALASRRPLPGRAREVGLRRDHGRDRQGRPVLLRRGLPPAVPRQEPERLLRPGRDGRELSCTSDSGERVTTGVPAGIVPSRASSATRGSMT